MSTETMPGFAHDEHRARNRRLLRVLLMIMATLVVASLLVGVRW
jgi:hypothetical protein